MAIPLAIITAEIDFRYNIEFGNLFLFISCIIILIIAKRIEKFFE